MRDQAVTVSDTEILIELDFFVHKDYSITRIEFLLDIFSVHYTSQAVIIHCFDGENIYISGFINLVEILCDKFNIPADKITIETHNPIATTKFQHKQLSLSIFKSAREYINYDINRDVTSAKFVGTTIGRFTPTRIRLAYSIDQIFPNDNFMIMQPAIKTITQEYNIFSNLYQKELAWVFTKVFDKDIISTSYSGTVDWQNSYKEYNNIWNKYLIEIISETDSMSNFWFTEKTGRCLATGKPFILVAGQGSLQHLRDLGFQTFSEVIDESYDLESIPQRRINMLLYSLNILYNSSDKQQKINRLYEIAKQNMLSYHTNKKIN